jgi:hypothetical protein
MSDEPKRRSRAWIGRAMLAAFVLYPLSIGPAYRYAYGSDLEDLLSNLHRADQAYAPLEWICERSEWAARAVLCYKVVGFGGSGDPANP